MNTLILPYVCCGCVAAVLWKHGRMYVLTSYANSFHDYTESSTLEDICGLVSPVALLGAFFLASAASRAASRRAAISSREGPLGAIPLPLLSKDGADTTPSCGKPVAHVPLDEEEELPARVCAEPGNYMSQTKENTIIQLRYPMNMEIAYQLRLLCSGPRCLSPCTPTPGLALRTMLRLTNWHPSGMTHGVPNWNPTLHLYVQHLSFPEWNSTIHPKNQINLP